MSREDFKARVEFFRIQVDERNARELAAKRATVRVLRIIKSRLQSSRRKMRTPVVSY